MPAGIDALGSGKILRTMETFDHQEFNQIKGSRRQVLITGVLLAVTVYLLPKPELTCCQNQV